MLAFVQQRSLISRFGFILNVNVSFSRSNTFWDGIPCKRRIIYFTKSNSLIFFVLPGTLIALLTESLKHARNETSFCLVMTPGSHTDKLRMWMWMLSSSHNRWMPDSLSILFSRIDSSTYGIKFHTEKLLLFFFLFSLSYRLFGTLLLFWVVIVSLALGFGTTWVGFLGCNVGWKKLKDG